MLLHLRLGFSDIDRQHDQALGNEFLVDIVHQFLLSRAIGTPGGPEFQQYDLALDALIAESFAGSGLGKELWCRFAFVRGGKRTERRRGQHAGRHSTKESVASRHRREYTTT